MQNIWAITVIPIKLTAVVLNSQSDHTVIKAFVLHRLPVKRDVFNYSNKVRLSF